MQRGPLCRMGRCNKENVSSSAGRGESEGAGEGFKGFCLFRDWHEGNEIGA